MMFGSRDLFEYSECSACGCLQIVDVPADLTRYYPQEYYSYGRLKSPNVVKRLLKKRRAAHLFGSPRLLGRGLLWLIGPPPFSHWSKPPYIGPDDAVLDVGCGSGKLLMEMHLAGFTDLTGIDPYIEGDVQYAPGLTVMRRTLDQMDRTFDVVMLHHVLEHFTDPRAMLLEAHRVLRPGRHVLVRTPVAGKYAWRTYQADWVQLDPPRHISVQTEKSLRTLAEQTGFSVDEVLYDSTSFQFWGSEQVRSDMPLRDERSYARGEAPGIFSRSEIRMFQRRAEELNASHDGDQACFYLRKV
jgi:SAM-dependent methyltransferase